MGSKDEDRPRKRFSRAGHTTHQPRVPMPPPPAYPTQQYPPPYQGPPPAYPTQQYPPPSQPPYQGPYQPPYQGPPTGQQPFGQPTYHHVARPSQQRIDDDRQPASPAVAMTKAAFTGTNRAVRLISRKVIMASKADGAHESGLTALIWNQVLSYGTDAMITVALAGTVFFGASAHAQRGNVLLYLLVTMAPFALVAPFIGPALDRFQHGRRWTMAGTAIGRGILALIMAGHPTDLVVLYPCALGSLVLSKAYVVVRAAAAPRLVPPSLSLTEANARMSIFALASTLIGGSFVGIVIKVSGSYTVGLVLTAIMFGVCAFFAFRLPAQVDSDAAAPRHPQEPPRPARQPNVPTLKRLHIWARHGFDDRVDPRPAGRVCASLRVRPADDLHGVLHRVDGARRDRGAATRRDPRCDGRGQHERHRAGHPDQGLPSGDRDRDQCLRRGGDVRARGACCSRSPWRSSPCTSARWRTR